MRRPTRLPNNAARSHYPTWLTALDGRAFGGSLPVLLPTTGFRTYFLAGAVVLGVVETDMVILP